MNYEIKERFEAGLELFGNEVKAIRNSKAQIDGAKIIIRGGEAFIVGMNVLLIKASEKIKKNFEPFPWGNDRTKMKRKLLKKI